MHGMTIINNKGSNFADHIRDQAYHTNSFMQSLDEMAAIIAIEGVEDSSSCGDPHNSTFILVNPIGTVTDISKH